MPRALSHIVTLWTLLGGAALLAITLVTSWNVGAGLADRLAETVGGDVTGLPGYEDFVRVVISGAALSFFPYCQMRRGHVAVTIFTDRMGAPAARRLERLWAGAIAALALFLLYWMARGLAESRADGAETAILGWPVWPFYLPGLVSLALWALVAACQAAGREAA